MKTKIEKILVLITAQQQSKQFITLGYDMAKETSGELYVLHIANEEHKSDMEHIQTLAEYVCSLGGQFSFLWDCEPQHAVKKFVKQNHITKLLIEQTKTAQTEPKEVLSEKRTVLSEESLIA